MFRRLDAVITIGRDMEAVLMRYPGVTRDKIAFIPNWATMPASYRPVDPENPFRKPFQSRFIVGLSGNLGFTHDPATVFEAARRLAQREDIGFLLSGWGVGWQRLKEMQSAANLPNVTLVERVDENDLATFLAAANVWVIPYLPKMAGISVPSRLYNLMAIGRPVIVLAEPEAEHALILSENDVGWSVEPANADELAAVIARAAADPAGTVAKGERAVQTVGTQYTLAAAQAAYRKLARKLLDSAGTPERRTVGDA
jgi:glycosyltransferase involved in cell wall biosynthesis